MVLPFGDRGRSTGLLDVLKQSAWPIPAERRLRYVFETVLERCINEGLVGGEGFATDTSVIKADANRARGVSGAEFAYADRSQPTTRAVREYLAALDEETDTVRARTSPSPTRRLVGQPARVAPPSTRTPPIT